MSGEAGAERGEADIIACEQRAEVRRTIRDLVWQRGTGKSVCPSEVARRLCPSQWRSLMPLVREVAAEMNSRGELRVMQRGEPVQVAAARGPIRLALPAARGDGQRPASTEDPETFLP